MPGADRISRRGLTAGLVAFGLPGVATAAAGPDCRKRAAYVGRPLHAPPPAAAFTEAAAPFGGDLPATEAAALDKAFADLRTKLKVEVLSAAVARPGGGLWSATAAAAPETRMFWASVGKAFTATVILQLVEEGRLSLDDRLSRWAPEFPNSGLITLDDLLGHTSGLYSFQEDAGLRARPGYKSPDTVLAVARDHPALFCPGGGWSYSNTGYVLLGRIIEAVEGEAYAATTTRRIVARLGLTRTVIIPADGVPADIPAPAPTAGGGTSDDLRTPFAAGAVAASATDMIRFWQGLLAGRLTSTAAVRERFGRLYPLFDQPGVFYGRGVMLYDLPVAPEQADLWLGHSGGMPGLKAVVAWSTRHRAFVSVAFVGEGPAEAAANLLLRQMAATA